MDFPYHSWKWSVSQPISQIKYFCHLKHEFEDFPQSEWKRIVCKDSIQLILPLSPNGYYVSKHILKGPVTILKILKYIREFYFSEIPNTFFQTYPLESNPFAFWIRNKISDNEKILYYDLLSPISQFHGIDWVSEGVYHVKIY